METGIGCLCNAQDIILHPLSLYRLVFANLAKINATLSSLGRPAISTQYPYRSSDTSYKKPNSEGFAGQHVFGSFNMATGQEEDSVVCSEGCGWPFITDYVNSNNLIIEEFSCRGDVCN